MNHTTDAKHVVYDTSHSGLRRTLGKLESAVMSTIWESDKPCNVDAVLSVLGTWYEKSIDPGNTSDKLRYTSVASVMVRLAEKKLLERKAERGTYYYVPTMSEDEYNYRVVDVIMKSLLTENKEDLIRWLDANWIAHS